MFETLYEQMAVLMLVFVRFTGMLAFNPLLSRRGVPAAARMGFVISLTMLVAPGLSAEPFTRYTTVQMVGALFRELAVGFVCGCVFQVFYYMLIFAGDQMDMAFGLSMARAFNPNTNIQMSVSSNYLNLFFILYLFATNSHHILIRLFTSSYLIIPPGQGVITQNVAQFMFELFSYAFSLAVQLSLPFVAMELIMEFSIGILMKFIPQINVFVINIQLKILLGLFLLFAFTPVVGTFLTNYLDTLFRRMQDILYFLV